MRFLVVAFTSILIVGIILFLVLSTPQPQIKKIEVSRLDMEQQPKPVAPSDPASDHILDFFPDPQEIAPKNVSPQPQEEKQPPPKQETSKFNQQELDKNRLLALVQDWVYSNFSQVGDSKVGRIEQVRENKYIEVFEGKKLDNGIEVFQLTEEQCMLKLGDAKFALLLVQKPDFFDEVHDNWRPLTPEEQKQAYDYYEKRYGRLFRERAKGYKPPGGMPMPQPVSPQKQEKARQQYFDKFGKQFEKENKQNPPEYPGPKEQKENFDKYWETYYPDLPKPEFKHVQGMEYDLGPGNRIREDAENNNTTGQ